MSVRERWGRMGTWRVSPADFGSGGGSTETQNRKNMRHWEELTSPWISARVRIHRGYV